MHARQILIGLGTLVAIAFAAAILWPRPDSTTATGRDSITSPDDVGQYTSLAHDSPRGWQSTYTQIHFADFEWPQPLPGLRLGFYGDSKVTTDPAEIVAGYASVRLSQYGWLETDPDILPLSGNTYYMVEFDYRILDRGTDNSIVNIWFQPAGATDASLYVSARELLSNSETAGTFSAGVLTPDGSIYQLVISSSENASIVIDNLRIIRQDTTPITNQPASWAVLSRLPFPRLGNYIFGMTNWLAYDGAGNVAFSVDEIEERMAFSDVVAGLYIGNQTRDPDLARRLRQMNPSIVILPYRIAQEQGFYPDDHPPTDATLDPYFDFRDGLADEWIAKDTNGDPVPDPDFIYIRKMNISEFSPVVNGQTFNDYLIDWVVNQVMASGVWDGIFFDNLFGRINPHILNYNDPALLDYDVNLNGLRDETPAWASEMTRAASIRVLERLRSDVGDLEIIMRNTGTHPEISLAPYVNGFLFECWDDAWLRDYLSSPSEAGWRRALDEYITMQSETMSPHMNILEGCGRTGSIVEPEGNFLEASAEDIEVHRFTLGTALLGDGFYEYDLFDARSAPYWFDEYTVDENGVAVEDRRYKGYLGLALNDALELASPATLVWEEDFEAGTLPPELWAQPGAYVSQLPDDVIAGAGSLVLDNPDHTQRASISVGTDANIITFTAGRTYVFEFDWKILETIDGGAAAELWGSDDDVEKFILPGVVTGDAGRARFHATIRPSPPYSLGFQLGGGGGKVAIDNVRITDGGAGPWRRDFENGFVLVNPINRPYTFSAAELAGELHRTGIRRILGTQAPDVNNGQAVSDTLTLEPFDAIILLADQIPTAVTPTPVPAATPMPTPTPPGLASDVNCDGSANSIDAALILQFDAGLINSLACQQNADANGDGSINSIDAALILQLDAGLISSL